MGRLRDLDGNYIEAATASDIEGIDLSVYQQTDEKDQVNGYAGLDSGGKLLAAQLPGAAATDVETAAAVAALSAVYQALDSDLTAIAALSTTAYGRGLLTLADQAALQAAVAAQPLDSDLTAIAALATTTYGRSLLTPADAAAARVLLGIQKRAINFVIDGGGSAITTGVKGDIVVPFAWSDIESATILADQSGSIVVNIWKDTYANFPPVVGDKITASAPPTLSAATKSQDSTLTGWTKTGAAGDVLRFNVDSITTVTRVTVVLVLIA